MHTMKEERKELDERLSYLTEKYEKDQSTWQKEQRLLASAMFEFGVRINNQKRSRDQTRPGAESFLASQQRALHVGSQAALNASTTKPSMSTPTVARTSSTGNVTPAGSHQLYGSTVSTPTVSPFK
jgi:hypothetical protein